MELRTFLADHSISVGELASGIGLERSTAGNKVYGLRPWYADEAARLIAFLRKYDPSVTFESLFGSALPPAVGQ